jgi:hypothetical protein
MRAVARDASVNRESGTLTRLAGDQIALAAITSIDEAADAAQRALYPEPLHSERMHAQAIRNRAPLNIADAHTVYAPSRRTALATIASLDIRLRTADLERA